MIYSIFVEYKENMKNSNVFMTMLNYKLYIIYSEQYGINDMRYNEYNKEYRKKWLSQSKLNMINIINIKYEVIMININTYTSDLNDHIYIYIYILNYNYIIW